MNFKIFFKTFLEMKHIHPLSDEVWNNAIASNEELRNAVALMQEINQKFPQKDIFIVGGVPRDLLLGLEVADVDLATNIPFDELSKYFTIRNISKLGGQPVYTLLFNGFNYDVASFRTDSKTHGRKNNTSTITNSFEEDSSRRDVGINSFGLTADGKIIDYQNGIADLNNKVIRAVGDARERFLEDASRILRIVRFAAKLGFGIEEDTKKAIIEMKDILNKRDVISNEAISKEFYKAAKSGKTLRKFVEGLVDMGILKDILPEFHAMDGMMHNIIHHPEGEGKVLGHILECLSVSKFSDPVINLGVLFHDFGKATTYKQDGEKHTYHGHEAAGVPIVEGIFKRLVFPDLSAEDKKAILNAVANHMLVHNLLGLNVKTLTRLVNDPTWDVLKSVSYCDEASRGSLFDPNKFDEKIRIAEEKVAALGNATVLKNKIREKIDGVKLMEWFPILKTNNALIGKVLPDLQDYVLSAMEKGQDLTDIDLFKKASEIIKIKKLA